MAFNEKAMLNQEEVLKALQDCDRLVSSVTEDTKKVAVVCKEGADATNLNIMKSIAEFTDSLVKAVNEMEESLADVKSVVRKYTEEIEDIDRDDLGIE